MKKDLKKRIKTYSITAGAVITASSVNAGIVYTDVNPDSVHNTSGDVYDIDLNNDGIADFTIDLTVSSVSSNTVFITPLNGNGVAGTTGGFNYAYALSSNDTVSAGISGWFSSGFGTMAYTYGNGSGSFGNWNNATDKYLGLRFSVGGNLHYGWARLDVNGVSGQFVIKDYAYEDVPNTAIITGAIGGVTAEPATNVFIVDVGNSSNGADLQVNFNRATDETTLSEYRIFVVKTSASAAFDLSSAQAQPSANYTVVAPTGSNITTNLSAIAKDTDGDDITIGENYTVFVQSVADGTIATIDNLSGASQPIILVTPTSPATNLIATDVLNTNNAIDFEFSFNVPAGEFGIDEYRVIVVKSADAAGFGLSQALVVADTNYTTVLPTGVNVQQQLAAGSRDKDGDPIVQNVPYRFVVLSMANGIDANADTISGPSPELTLTFTTGIDQSLSEVKIYNSNRDLFINLNEADKQTMVEIYDLQGRKCFESRINDKQNRISLKMGEGVYVLKMLYKGEVFTHKLSLQ